MFLENMLPFTNTCKCQFYLYSNLFCYFLQQFTGHRIYGGKVQRFPIYPCSTHAKPPPLSTSLTTVLHWSQIMKLLWSTEEGKNSFTLPTSTFPKMEQFKTKRDPPGLWFLQEGEVKVIWEPGIPSLERHCLRGPLLSCPIQITEGIGTVKQYADT